MVTNVRHQSAPMPMGCRWCGVPQHDNAGNHHLTRSTPGHLGHEWEQPTRAQVDARMNVRHAKRRTAPTREES